jgi:rhamnose utilization protein RhaD (predicted bifunctional aldolase and dehydrogenase)
MQLDSIIALSVELGSNVRLVQGAGGNVSLKSGGDFWIKGSGTWLVEASDRPIFTHLDLKKVHAKLAEGSDDFSSCLRDGNSLRPSIETSLHAVMPHSVVAHVHSINALSWAVRREGRNMVAERLAGLNWAWVEYVRPGLSLTQSIQSILAQSPRIDVLLLANHGLVIAANTVGDVRSLLYAVEARLLPPCTKMFDPNMTIVADVQRSIFPGGRLPANPCVHILAQESKIMELVVRGALYPDHVVFLGAMLPVVPHSRAHILQEVLAKPPYCAIIPGVAVILGPLCSAGAEAMLECLAILAPTLPERDQLRYLSDREIAELVDWDAEKLRQAMNKNDHPASKTI